MKTIQCLPINKNGDLLFLKNLRQEGNKYFISYRAMINDIPFQEEELYLVDNGQNFVITGSNAKVLYKFPIQYALSTQE